MIVQCDRCLGVMNVNDPEYQSHPWQTLCDFCAEEMEHEFDMMQREQSHDESAISG